MPAQRPTKQNQARALLHRLRRFSIQSIIISVVFLIPAVLAADVIYLKNGKVLKGRVYSYDGRVVIFQVPGRKKSYFFLRRNVLRVVYSGRGARARRAKAARRGRGPARKSTRVRVVRRKKTTRRRTTRKTTRRGTRKTTRRTTRKTSPARKTADTKKAAAKKSSTKKAADKKTAAEIAARKTATGGGTRNTSVTTAGGTRRKSSGGDSKSTTKTTDKKKAAEIAARKTATGGGTRSTSVTTGGGSRRTGSVDDPKKAVAKTTDKKTAAEIAARKTATGGGTRSTSVTTGGGSRRTGTGGDKKSTTKTTGDTKKTAAEIAARRTATGGGTRSTGVTTGGGTRRAGSVDDPKKTGGGTTPGRNAGKTSGKTAGRDIKGGTVRTGGGGSTSKSGGTDGPRRRLPRNYKFDHRYSALMVIPGDAQVTLAAGDAMSPPVTIYHAVNDGPYTRYRAPLEFPRSGVYSIRFYSVDAVGNREAPRIVHVLADGTAPVITIETSGPVAREGKRIYSRDGIVFVRAADDHSGISDLTCRVNGRKVTPGKGGLINLKDNLNLINCNARDLVDNETNSATHEVVLDRTGPEIAWRRTNDGKGDATNPVLSRSPLNFHARDTGAGLATLFLLVDGKAHKLPLAGRVINPAKYASGGRTHEFRLRAIDRLGNASVSAPLFIRTDRRAPRTRIEILR